MHTIKRTAAIALVSLFFLGNAMTVFPHAANKEWDLDSGWNDYVGSVWAKDGYYRNIRHEKTGDVMVSLVGSGKQSDYKDALARYVQKVLPMPRAPYRSSLPLVLAN